MLVKSSRITDKEGKKIPKKQVLSKHSYVFFYPFIARFFIIQSKKRAFLLVFLLLKWPTRVIACFMKKSTIWFDIALFYKFIFFKNKSVWKIKFFQGERG